MNYLFLLPLFLKMCVICLPCFSENIVDSTIVVTCATGELGNSIAQLLAPTNHLILVGRDIAKLKDVQKDLSTKYKKNYEYLVLDYSHEELIHQLNDNFVALNLKNKIDGIVLITPRPAFSKNLLAEQSDWLKAFQLMFTGPIEVIKGALSHLSQNASIVIIAGTTSLQYSPNYGRSGIFRRLWTTYSKALSHELGPQGIRVNCISPGVVLTSFHQQRICQAAQLAGCSYDEQMVKDVANIPLKRHALPEEVAKTVKFLLSSESSFVTGTNLIVDGGITLSY